MHTDRIVSASTVLNYSTRRDLMCKPVYYRGLACLPKRVTAEALPGTSFASSVFLILINGPHSQLQWFAEVALSLMTSACTRHPWRWSFVIEHGMSRQWYHWCISSDPMELLLRK